MSSETAQNGPNHVFDVGNTDVSQNKVAYRSASSISPRNTEGFCRAPPALVVSVLLTATVLICLPVRAFAQCEPWLARLVSAQGQVELQGPRESGWRPAELNQHFCLGDKVRTLDRSRASLQLANDSYLSLDQTTTIVFSQSAKQLPSWLDLLKGVIYLRSRTPRAFGVRTPFVNATIKGTEFGVKATDDSGSIDVYEGIVEASNRQGTLNVHSGETVAATAGKAPQPALHLRPTDAVAWALYYPPIIDYATLGRKPMHQLVRKALRAYSSGQIRASLVILDAVPEIERNPSYLHLKAGLLLTLGRSDEAEPLIATLLAAQPEDATALALHSVVVLAKNDKNTALALAERAVAAERNNPIPLIALSYAEQAEFKLERALRSVDTAVSLSPENGLAHARRAELLASLGRTSEALASAEKAKRLNPGFARSYTVLGFIHLMAIDLEEAKGNFQEAIFIDSADPLARFGLGLAKIRQGELEAGTEEIEIAASLDPTDSLTRSYLGKAYYEQKREKLAETEYELAKQFDPKDPTPWFYEAIKKQTGNRPVEALYDLQQAIKLNNNRAVYRSSQMLDSDLAARSAAQGRVYRDLGFEQLALVEGWKSVNTDPANYSAHRLLADSYSIRPRSDIARVSELFQSQLLQPINLTPVQPHLAEKNLFVLEGIGPSSTGFNEFNPVFTRNRFTFQASGMVGSHDTYGDEVVHSGVWKNFSYSIGQYHYETRGFRKNNDVRNDVINGFVQAALTPSLSILAEIRHKELERGDIDLLANGDFDSGVRFGVKNDTGRVGVHYTINQHSDLIASFFHLDGENSVRYSSSEPTDKFTTYGNQGEAQHLFRSNFLSTVTGFGFSQAGFAPKDKPKKQENSSHANGYLYAYVHYPKNLDWTFGISVDSFDADNREPIKQINPKFGGIWHPIPNTTIRLAAFRQFKRTLITNQTIEPTQIAGFNQLFEDFAGTDSWLYGIAIDQKLTSDLYSGVEFFARELTLITGKDTNWDEQSYRAYFNWNISPKWSANISYYLEDFKAATATQSFVPLLTKTHQAKAGLRFFDPSGFFAHMEATYINQKSDWPELYPLTTDDFVVFNAGFGFRLPRRLGILRVEIRNLFDEKFNFQSSGPRSPPFAVEGSGEPPPFIPDRSIFAQFTIAL